MKIFSMRAKSQRRSTIIAFAPRDSVTEAVEEKLARKDAGAPGPGALALNC